MEKLRKALEKKAVCFCCLQAGKHSSVKNEAREVFGHYSGSKLAGRFAGGMEDKQQLDGVAAYAVRNDIRRARNHQLPSAGYSPWSA